MADYEYTCLECGSHVVDRNSLMEGPITLAEHKSRERRAMILKEVYGGNVIQQLLNDLLHEGIQNVSGSSNGTVHFLRGP